MVLNQRTILSLAQSTILIQDLAISSNIEGTATFTNPLSVIACEFTTWVLHVDTGIHNF